ncbi:hypothetical protein ACIA8G_31895 [Lentzea sp. NPDC051213]|uniref:hypothetical protein n=1 Tax=Lentzea sp. NPDC051213 TaxID=3364126 RepID=UPI0037AD129F
MERRFWKTVGGVVAAMALILATIPAATVLAGQDVVVKEVPVSAASIDSTGHCDFRRGVHVGRVLCGSHIWTYVDFQWSDGRWETFVVGTDAAVHHIWQRWNGDTEWSGWQTFGGRVYQGVRSLGSTTNRPRIAVAGGDFNGYCLNFDGRNWTGWYHC